MEGALTAALAFVVVLVAGCRPPSDRARVDARAEVAPTPPPPDAGDATDAARDGDASAPLDPRAELGLHYGHCLGHCVPLTLTLRADGTFTGRGPARTLDAATTRRLFELAAAAFTPPPRCPRGPTDLQYATVTFLHGGATESATYPRGAPCSKALRELEAQLEAVR